MTLFIATLASGAAPGVPENWLGYAALGAVIVLTFWGLRSTQRKMRSSSSPQAFAREHISRLRSQEEVKGTMEHLLVELQDLSRQINAQIDTKFAKLEVSIRTADQRIEQLERLLRATHGNVALDATVGDEPQASPARQGNIVAPAGAEHELIRNLARSGSSTAEIARRTSLTPGEVELILALNAPTHTARRAAVGRTDSDLQP